MNAAVYETFGGPIQIQRVPRPKCPENGVLIQVQATGVCRSDWHGWRGHDSDISDHGLPFVPGHEFSGILVEHGRHYLETAAASGSLLQVGDRVVAPFLLSCGSCRYCCAPRHRPTVCTRQQQPGFTYWGSFAEYVAVPWAARNVKKLPDQVSFVQAASLGCRFTTAYRAILQQGRLQAGESVAIFGCGGLGLSCIMLASSQGASPIVAVDVSQAALNKARELGATHTVLVPRGGNVSSNNETARARVMEICAEGPGADLSVDAAGFPATCENAVYCARRAGRMIQVGLPLGDHPQDLPQIPMGRVVGWELELIGSHGFAADDLPDLLQRVASGQFDPGVLVQREVSLREGAQALQDMDRGSPLGVTMITSFDDGRPTTTATSKL